MKKYIKPTIEVIEVDKTDIIQTSAVDVGGEVVFPDVVPKAKTLSESADPFQN